MNDILDFLIKHWQVSGLLVLVLVAYIGYEIMQGSDKDVISPEQAVAIINHQHGVVVDVRTPDEFKAGHVLNAINFDCRETDDKLKKLNKYSHKPVILICAHGRRSADFLKRMQAQGFSQVYSVGGGLQAWQDAGLPITQE
jgi:rhodanese-related sulfurtransferase